MGEQERTIETFSYKWKSSPEEMRKERGRLGTPWFFSRFPLMGSTELERLLWLRKKIFILEAGCGLGDLVTWLARTAPHADVVGVDMSSAIENIEPLPNLELIRCDLRDIPIKHNFDLIVSDGVLHHTPDTRESFLSLAQRLTPGGEILAYVYKKKAPVREFADDFIRSFTTKMSPEKCMEVCHEISSLGKQLREANITIHFDKGIDFLGIKPGDMDLQRFFYWTFMKCFWDDGGGGFTTSDLENFDWYHPVLAWRHTREEVEEWVDAAELEMVMFNEVDAGFAIHARKP